MDFKMGDVVVLKSGGPKMTVDDTAARSNDEVVCKWFSGADIHRQAFHREMLKKVHEDAEAASTADAM